MNDGLLGIGGYIIANDRSICCRGQKTVNPFVEYSVDPRLAAERINVIVRLEIVDGDEVGCSEAPDKSLDSLSQIDFIDSYCSID